MKKAVSRFIILPLLLVFGLLACTNYGQKVSHDYLEVYYKGGITKDQAQKTADFLYPYWKDNNNIETSKKSIQLTQNGDTIIFRLVTDEKKMALVDDETLYTMSKVFSDSLFNGAPVNLDLTTNTFKTVRTLHFKKPDMNEPEKSDSTQ